MKTQAQTQQSDTQDVLFTKDVLITEIPQQEHNYEELYLELLKVQSQEKQQLDCLLLTHSNHQDKWRIQIDQMEKQYNDLRQTLINLQEQMDNQVIRNKNQLNQIEQSRVTIADLDDAKQTQLTRNKELQFMIEDLRQSQTNQEEQIKSQRHKNIELQNINNDLQTMNKLQASNTSGLETQISQLNESVHLSSKQAESYNRQIQWIESIKDEETRIIKKAASDQIQQLVETQAILNSELENINKQHDLEWTNRCAIVNQELDAKKSLILFQQSDYSTLYAQINVKDEQMREIEMVNQQLRNDLLVREQEIETQNDIKYKLMPENLNLKRQILMHSQINKKLKYENNSLLKLHDEKETEVNILKDFNKSMKSIQQSKEKDIIRLKQRLHLIESEFSSIREKYQNLQDVCQGILVQNGNLLSGSPYKRSFVKELPREQFVIRRRSVSHKKNNLKINSDDYYRHELIQSTSRNESLDRHTIDLTQSSKKDYEFKNNEEQI